MALLNPDAASGWVADSNEATVLRLISGENVSTIENFLNQSASDESLLTEDDCDAEIVEFHPSFTYPIYGELERIFGYKGLKLHINYAAGSLKTYLQINYKSKVDNLESLDTVPLKADKVEDPMKEVLSTDLVENAEDFVCAVVKDTKEFIPHGKKLSQYTIESDGDSVYEIYENRFSDKAFRQFHERLQTFVLFYIEGGQFVDDTDEKWIFYTLYKKANFGGAFVYSFVGFCSLYNYYNWPDKIRARISQFLVLPPYQQFGHGSKFYNYIRGNILANPLIIDLTVEDPNEAFDDMRDKNDIRWLISTGKISTLDKPLRFRDLHDRMSDCKFSKKQLIRIAELCLLRNLNKQPHESSEAKEFRIWVKKRIFRQHHDMLIEMEPEERKKKLKETFDSVYQDYIRILSTI